MPLLDGNPVSPLPIASQLSRPRAAAGSEPVWLIEPTAEIFTDYESYANRYIFYSQPIFTPRNDTNRTVSFFEALNIEHRQLDQQIRTNFPISLKQNILNTIKHQAEPNIDHLVDYLYSLYHNRFNVAEKVIVDLPPSTSSSEVYHAKVIRVFPPKPIRDLDKSSYDHLIHLQSLNRFPELDLNQCLQIDIPTDYLYTIQLIDDQSKSTSTDSFGASYMEVEAKKLSRHTDTFSKPLLKRFLQSILTTSTTSRWTIHPDVCLPTTIPIPEIPIPTYKSLIKSLTNDHPEPELKKRKIVNPTDLIDHEECPQVDPASLKKNIIIIKPKNNNKLGSDLTINTQQSTNPVDSQNTSTTTPSTATTKKTIKYPIEDLDLDPFTIIDGRYLRRSINPTPLKLPIKPKTSIKNLGKKFSQKLKIWSIINIFKLNTIRLKFEELDSSLDLITSELVSKILNENRLKYPTTSNKKFTSISILPYFSNKPIQESKVMNIDEREYWVRKGLRFVNVTKRLHNLGLSNSSSNNGKRKNNKVVSSSSSSSSSGEENWVMGLIEILCHRGGIESLGCTARLLKYLLSSEGKLIEIDHEIEEDDSITVDQPDSNQVNHKPRVQPTTTHVVDSPLSNDSLTDPESELTEPEGEEHEEEEEEDLEPEIGGHETADEDGLKYGRSIRNIRQNPLRLRKLLLDRYRNLGSSDKFNLLEFLVDLVVESDHVRNYLEESDETLTVIRREKAEVNKEKRKVLEELARLEVRKLELSNNKVPSSTSTELVSKNNERINGSQSTTIDDPSRSEIPPTSSTNGIEGIGEVEGERSTTKIRLTIKSSSAITNKKKEEIIRPFQTPIRTATLLSKQIKLPSPPPPSSSIDPNHHQESESSRIIKEKIELETQLFDLSLKELKFNESFRQLINVFKLKPLGFDRFFLKYWWFDGIGGLEIHPSNSDDHNEEESSKWYSGCIFVSGPTSQEWDKISNNFGGHHSLLKRRMFEELGIDSHSLTDLDLAGIEDALVGVDEWAIYDTEDQIEELMNWLNSKGIRENQLKSNLKEWKEYILDGVRQRHQTQRNFQNLPGVDPHLQQQQEEEDQDQDQDQEEQDDEEEEEEDDESLESTQKNELGNGNHLCKKRGRTTTRSRLSSTDHGLDLPQENGGSDIEIDDPSDPV
ncbi:hypothetical protein PSTG_13278 [Puccinia striiformis f. sp. tritici PST-78]|uniref:WAC domain-containing protein n=1 Tax=Puccinia striiformis f. sp. tritici PST-78 TaxID=1165861 RepID=A0A0L0V2D0_9BASI|nr:hypothetical protein PSTG_13278 [Puccinia striiformis f. sp. tritici PST-78]